MLFGNWIITEDSLAFNGSIGQRFVIPTREMNKTRNNHAEGIAMYEWILLATDEEWLTENDLYDLNYAFVFAAAKYGIDFDYAIFDATLAEQFEQFESEDNENPEP